MSDEVQSATREYQPPSTRPALRNPAVQACLNARKQSIEASRAEGRIRFETNQRAEEAYRLAIPDISSYENIRDFVACVTHGMLLNVILYDEGTKLLYAARVALAAIDHESKAAATAAKTTIQL